MLKKIKNIDIPFLVINKLKLFSYLYRIIKVAKETKIKKETSYIRIGIVEDSTLILRNKESLNLITFKEIIKRNDFFYDYMFKNKDLEVYFLNKFYNFNYSDNFYLDYGLDYDNFWWHKNNYLILNPIEINEIFVFKETYIILLKYNIFLNKLSQNINYNKKNNNNFFFLKN